MPRLTGTDAEAEGLAGAVLPTGGGVCGLCCEKTKLETVSVKMKGAIVAGEKIFFTKKPLLTIKVKETTREH